MAKRHPRSYSLEFRQNVVEPARTGKKPVSLAVQFEIAPQTVPGFNIGEGRFDLSGTIPILDGEESWGKQDAHYLSA